MNYAWLAAVALVGMFAVVAYATINDSEEEEVVCIEQHGRWVSGGAGMGGAWEVSWASTGDKVGKSDASKRYPLFIPWYTARRGPSEATARTPPGLPRAPRLA